MTRYAVTFQAGDPPRTGRMVFWEPASSSGLIPNPLPVPLSLSDTARIEPGEATVVDQEEGTGEVRLRRVPVLQIPIMDTLPLLITAYHRAVSRSSRSGSSHANTARNTESTLQEQKTPGGDSDPATSTEPVHPTMAFWGGVALLALHLIARGRMLPGVSAGEFDAWRVGPLDADDIERIRQLAAAMPPQARAIPLTTDTGGCGDDPLVPDTESMVRAFLDAVADAMPRTPAAAAMVGGPLFAGFEPQRVPRLRPWAEEIAAGTDAGVRISLRLEPIGPDLPPPEPLKVVPQVHSLADPTVIVDAGTLWSGEAPVLGPQARMDALLAIRRIARAWRPLERLLEQAVPDQLPLSDEDITDLLHHGIPRLAEAGVEVHWPKELVHDLTAHAVIDGADLSLSELPSFFGGDALLRFDWRLALGGHPLTEAEMEQLAASHRPIVRLRDRWTVVDPELARRARERSLKPLSVMEALNAALTGTTVVDGEPVEVVPTGWLQTLRERLQRPVEEAEPIQQPAALAATLRDYQLHGLRWLARMTELGLGCCLADDMGLGKTVTLIALHLHRQQNPATAGPTLVVCPASLLGNWEREIQRFAPGVPVLRFHGPGRRLDTTVEGFVLTTYGTMRLDASRLAEVDWALVVADEAQHVKNPLSNTAKALRTIPARARVALTGTPVENNLSELWAILDWATPGLLGSLSAFRARWAKPIEADRDPVVTERLARLVGPFLLRRRKSDPQIVPELPPKTETDRPVALTPEQVGLYQAVVRESMERIRNSGGMARRGLILKMLTALKQICNHPAQYLNESRPRLAGRSGKLELFDELVDTILAEGGAVLVFTQYVAMARLIERHLADRGVPSLLLHGDTPVARREEMVRRFCDPAAGVPVFLLSLKAAGTGLNLTRADHVIHYDRWWNPAVEEQATDRAYRIGQTKPVQVHRLITEGTVEDRIAVMLESKRALAEAVLASGEAALTELSDAELADLVELRRTR